MWARLFRDQARQKLCYHQISGLLIANWPPAELRDFRRAEAVAHVAIAADLAHEPYDGDDKSERRLATLLWRWTCPKTDLPAFMQCDESADDIGTQMWGVIMKRYQLRTSAEVGEHRRLLQRKQQPGENIQDFWISLNNAWAYMISAGRHLDDTNMCDLVKDNVLPLHMSRTSLIEPLITTKADLEALIFSRGVHLEAKELALQSDMKTKPTAFPAFQTDDDDMQGVLDQLASLTARFSGRGGGRGGGRIGRGGGRGVDARSCYECGKQGHLRPNCPELPKNKNKHDKAQGPNDHAGPAVAFVTSTYALMSAASSSSSPPSEVTWCN